MHPTARKLLVSTIGFSIALAMPCAEVSAGHRPWRQRVRCRAAQPCSPAAAAHGSGVNCSSPAVSSNAARQADVAKAAQRAAEDKRRDAIIRQLADFVPVRVRANFYDPSLDENHLVNLTDEATIREMWLFVKEHLRQPESAYPSAAAGGTCFDLFDKGGNRHRCDYDIAGGFHFDNTILGQLKHDQCEKLVTWERTFLPPAEPTAP